jgi:hypothetical protein
MEVSVKSGAGQPNVDQFILPYLNTVLRTP